jgi:hypothetical protein
VNWSNAPSPAEQYGSDGVTHGDWRWYEFDVTALAQAWFDGTQANNGVMLRGEEERLGRRGFSTREGPHAPELVIHYRAAQATPTATPTRTPTPTRTATRLATPTATQPASAFFTYLPVVLKDLFRQGPMPTATPTPVAVPTMEPCPDGYLAYLGTTDQNRPVGLCVKPDFSAVTRASLNYSISCNHPDYGASTLWQRSSDDGWPIQDRAFRIEAYLTFDLAGTFSADFTAVQGTWQGIEGACSGFPGPCWEVCRGPIGQWSAVRQ